jgi:hypothetical protein
MFSGFPRPAFHLGTNSARQRGKPPLDTPIPSTFERFSPNALRFSDVVKIRVICRVLVVVCFIVVRQE